MFARNKGRIYINIAAWCVMAIANISTTWSLCVMAKANISTMLSLCGPLAGSATSTDVNSPTYSPRISTVSIATLLGGQSPIVFFKIGTFC